MTAEMLVLDTVNFGSGWFPTLAKRPGLSGFRTVEAGCLASRSDGRIGRRTSSPPQFGQRPASTPSAQLRQKVHS